MFGSGTMTHCMPAALADLTPLGLSSKTRHLVGSGGGLNLKEDKIYLSFFSLSHGGRVWMAEADGKGWDIIYANLAILATR